MLAVESRLLMSVLLDRLASAALIERLPQHLFFFPYKKKTQRAKTLHFHLINDLGRISLAWTSATTAWSVICLSVRSCSFINR